MNEDCSLSYYSILTAEVLYSKSLNDAEKLLYGVVTTLANVKGYCFASNEYMGKLRGKAPETISRQVKKIERLGFFRIEYDYNGKVVKQRRIFPLTNIAVAENVNGAIDKKSNCTIDENVKDNNKTSLNNNINIEDYFNSVWKLYPKKQGKGQVSKSKKKSILKYTLEQWKEIIRRYDSSVLDKMYLVNGSTFFNGRYIDYIDENYSEQNYTSEKKKPTDTLKYRPNFSENTKEDDKSGAEFFVKFKGGNLGK